MDKTGNIIKSAAILLQDRKLLVEKDSDKEFFISPGGKLEVEETPKEALVRELNEEFLITVDPDDLEEFGEFHAPASGQEHRMLHMHVFIVKKYSGIISKGHKVEKIEWINSQIPEGMKVGSIFEHEVIPQLKAQNLID
jgi:8-oxo-dGTP diphosphatase